MADHDQKHIRVFPASVEFAEGRLTARLVPYDEAVEVADLTPDGVERYREGFRAGAFVRQAGTDEPGVLRRVQLKHEHEGGIGYLGPLVSLEERDDGMYGEFRVLPSKREDVAELVDLGVREMSVEFLERKGGTVSEGDTRWRTDVHLDGVALLPQGAYGSVGAGVLSMRAAADGDESDEDDQPVPEVPEGAETPPGDESGGDGETPEEPSPEEAAAAAERKRVLDGLEEYIAAERQRQVELAERFKPDAAELRVLVYAADAGRCGHRLIWPVEALAAEGADVDVFRPDRPDYRPLEEADVVVLQRPMRHGWIEPLRRLQASGTRVVVDIDDNFRALSPRNAAWATHPHLGIAPGVVSWQALDEITRLADLVTVSTPALATVYGGHGRVRVIPNHVPASYLEVRGHRFDEVVVGWTGSVSVHPDDLQATRRGVASAIATTGARFGYVGGPGADVQHNLGLSTSPFALGEALGLPTPEGQQPGRVGLEDYPAAMAAIDVGIVPLADTAFNRAKSYLKGLEFAALGVPFVASPTDDYQRLAEHAGVLARKPRDWSREVRRLIESKDLRAEMADRGRLWAATQTIEGNAEQWWSAWESALAGKVRAA